jgi:hypothetical protein
MPFRPVTKWLLCSQWLSTAFTPKAPGGGGETIITSLTTSHLILLHLFANLCYSITFHASILNSLVLLSVFFCSYIPIILQNNYIKLSKYGRARSSVVVKALCYKPEGRGFDSR